MNSRKVPGFVVLLCDRLIALEHGRVTNVLEHYSMLLDLEPYNWLPGVHAHYLLALGVYEVAEHD